MKLIHLKYHSNHQSQAMMINLINTYYTNIPKNLVVLSFFWISIACDRPLFLIKMTNLSIMLNSK